MLRGLVRLIRYMDGRTGPGDLKVVEKLLREADVEKDDMMQACKFSDVDYARNTLAKSPWYELLVICWRSVQRSRIHNHGHSACGVRVVDGVATETVYREMSPGYVTPVATRNYSKGDVCVTSDNAIHLITNERPDEDLITLHLYTPPLKMRTYQLNAE